MNTFIVTEKQGKVLLPFPALIKRLASPTTVLWAFREITIRYPKPFGLSVDVFERLTRELALGFVISDKDLQKFIKAEFQIIDGCIDGYASSSLEAPSVTVKCIDSSQWEITTTSEVLAKELERSGFKR